MRSREAVRIVPRDPITVAIEEAGAPFAYGVVANISPGGACIWTNASLDAGSSLSLRLSLPRASQPLRADGVVVWGDPLRDASSRRYGLRWKDPAAPGLKRLASLIPTA